MHQWLAWKGGQAWLLGGLTTYTPLQYPLQLLSEMRNQGQQPRLHDGTPGHVDMTKITEQEATES